MQINRYILASDRLHRASDATLPPAAPASPAAETWTDIAQATPQELGPFLATMALHPLLLDRCLAPTASPGVVSYNEAVLVTFPMASAGDAPDPDYLKILLRGHDLVTIHAAAVPALDELTAGLLAEQGSQVRHLPELLYRILDALADLHVQSQIELRDRILRLAKTLTENPDTVKPADLTGLRWQVDRLVSLIENQLYCVAGLNASDNEALREPHRKAYIQDLVSEAEIAQRGVYRLEARVNDLYAFYQAAGSDCVERRLRFLTILSAVTLPLGLIAGLLGMNVGGVPATQEPNGFVVVLALMLAIGAVEFWYFRANGWLD